MTEQAYHVFFCAGAGSPTYTCLETRTLKKESS
jgi:hypothetical protein